MDRSYGTVLPDIRQGSMNHDTIRQGQESASLAESPCLAELPSLAASPSLAKVGFSLPLPNTTAAMLTPYRSMAELQLNRDRAGDNVADETVRRLAILKRP
jgi:hypothetical protein